MNKMDEPQNHFANRSQTQKTTYCMISKVSEKGTSMETETRSVVTWVLWG